MNFDEDFERYVKAWYATQKHAIDDQEFSADMLVELAPNVYDAWANAPNEKLGGESPRGYFAAIENPDKLIELFLTSPCALLYDRMIEVSSCGEGLIALVEKHESTTVREDAVSLLTEMGIAPPIELYVQIVCDNHSPDSLKDLCTEQLIEVAAQAAPMLYERIRQAEEANKARIAEILICAPPDERTFLLLKELFMTGGHVAQYASYLAKYGDARAAALLYPRLKTTNRNDYVEIRNAIESLGGVVDDE